MLRFTARWLVLCLLFVTFASPASAQGTTGSINGTVSDNTGAVLPGVTVTASGPAIMGVQSALTNEQGQYRFPALPPGTYKVQYELGGFNTIVREGIVVNIGFTATLNIQLQLASLAETVTVTGQSPVVDTQNSNVQTNFTLEMIKSLPNARDIWALIAVAPGTSMNSFDVGGSRAGTQTGYSASAAAIRCACRSMAPTPPKTPAGPGTSTTARGKKCRSAPIRTMPRCRRPACRSTP